MSDSITISANPATIRVTNALVDAPVGTFTITKTLFDSAGLVPADSSFSGHYECVTGEHTTGPLPWTLAAGATVTSEAVPVGSVCRVNESDPTSVAGGSWEPADVSTAVTITGEDSGLVTVTNTLTPTLSNAQPTDGRQNTLPETGSPASAALWAAAVALLGIGALTLWLRRSGRDEVTSAVAAGLATSADSAASPAE